LKDVLVEIIGGYQRDNNWCYCIIGIIGIINNINTDTTDI
jgi:hypothetical protein